MSKNLVIFCDGTWNSPDTEEYGVPAHTNVYRLYRECLDMAESDGRQFVWYQSGVGAMGSGFKRAFEGATGTGISDNIRRGYLAIAKNYKEGDRIFLFGFSRGAFTARSISGMIENLGLFDGRDANQYTAKRAYDLYRKTPGPKVLNDEHYKYIQEELGLKYVPERPKIHFIGVWDTVGALGFSFWGVSFNLAYFKNGFHNLSPNKITDHVYHALAMDERRTTFMPTLWEFPEKEDERRPEVEQAWFRGVHSDVGGGYADHDLADISRKWMLDNALKQGLLVRDSECSDYSENAVGRIHVSLKGALYAQLADWPRWYPYLYQEKGINSKFGYLHKSVENRELSAFRLGWNELPIRTIGLDKEAKVVIKAENPWNNTGLILEEGCTYMFKVKGWWQDAEGTPVDADGEDPERESFVKKLWRPFKRARNENWMKLIGLVNYPRDWAWSERSLLEALYYLIVRDPKILTDELFAIGKEKQKTIRKGESGILWVFANDWWKTYENNSGSLTMTVRRIK